MRILVYGAGKTGTTAVYYAFKNALPSITAVFEPSNLGKLNIPAHPKMLVKSLALIRHAQDALYGEWHDWFLQEDVDHFREVYGSYLDRFGYDVTLQNPEPLNERTTVAYSIKVANQGRRARWLPEYTPGEVNMTGEGVQYQRAQYAWPARIRSGRRDHRKSSGEQQSNCRLSLSEIAGLGGKGRSCCRRSFFAAGNWDRAGRTAVPPVLGTALVKAGHQSEGDAAFKIARELRQRVAS